MFIEDLIDHFCLSEKYKSKIVSEWLSATWVSTGISSFLQAYMGSRLVVHYSSTNLDFIHLVLFFIFHSLLTIIFRLPLIQCGSYTIVSFNTFILQSDRFICHPANETNVTVHTSNDDELHWKVREVAEVLSVESKCCIILNDDRLVSASRCHHRWFAPSNVSRIFRNHGIYFSQCWPTCCLSHDDARRIFSHGNLPYV